jgi:hypothetical protein
MRSLKDVDEYIFRYTPTGILIDTNTLVLFLMDKFDSGQVLTNKLTNNYCKEDLQSLAAILSRFDGKKKYITPHVVSEISNLIERGFLKRSDKFYEYVASFVEYLKSSQEEHFSIRDFCEIEIRFLADYGFSDIGIAETARKAHQKLPILTCDQPFYLYSLSQGLPAIYLKEFKLY